MSVESEYSEQEETEFVNCNLQYPQMAFHR